MASRSLGTLSLDLVARVGGFTAGLSQAEREADKRSKAISKRARDIEKAWGDVGKTIAAGFAGITIGAVFGKFIQESRDAQNEQAQLAAVLRSTGEAAGYTQGKLNDMASAMSQNSIFDDGDINKAQTRLLSYTNVVGKQFPEALQAAIDMASRLGISLEQSAETIGKALDVPSEGLTALSKQGFRFSEDQKKVIERLQQTGKTAEAQKIILDALNTSYGGAGKAARETFGGAIQGLQNQLNSLMTGEDGSLKGATDSVNELAKTLGSPEVRAAFNSLVQGLAGVVTWLGEATAGFINFGRFAGEALGKFSAGSADPIERLDEQIAGLTQDLVALNKEIANPRGFSAGGGYDGIEDLRKRALDAEKQIEKLGKVRADLVRGANNPARIVAPSGPALPRPGNVGSASKGKDPYAEAQRFLESLQKQLIKTQELTTAESVLAEIRSGRLGKITPEQEKQILYTAQQIDTLKDLEKAFKETEKANEDYIEGLKRSNKENQDWLEGMLGAGPMARLEKQRADLQRLAGLVESGRITPEQFNDAATGYLGLQGEIEKTKTLADELGLSFASAFEDAIAGGKGFKDVLSGLAQDISRIATRKLVTEPFGNAFSEFLKPVTSGGGSGIGGFLGNVGSWFKGLLNFDGGGSTGAGPRSGGMDGRGGFMAMLHPNETVLDHTKGQGMSGPVFNISVPVNGSVDARTRSQIAATIQQQLSYASQRFS